MSIVNWVKVHQFLITYLPFQLPVKVYFKVRKELGLDKKPSKLEEAVKNYRSKYNK